MDFNNSVGFSSTPSDLPLHHQAERTGAVGVDAKDMHRLGKRQEFKRNLFFLELPWIRIGVDGDLGVYFDVAVSELLLSWSWYADDGWGDWWMLTICSRTLLVLHHYCFVPQHHHSFSSRNDGTWSGSDGTDTMGELAPCLSFGQCLSYTFRTNIVT